MSHFKRLSLADRQEDSFNSGLLSDYDSRRLRTSHTSNGGVSPLRTHSKHSAISYDENLISNRTQSPSVTGILSPIRLPHGSTLRSSPLSHSKRYNMINDESIPHSRFSIQDETHLPGSPSLLSPNKSLSSSFSLHPGSPSFASRIASTANEMGVDQFPWISPVVPVIPIINSPHQSISSRTASPVGDSNSIRRNRVRVRLTGPNRSDMLLNSSSLETSSALDESSTTKSVIQALKEMSRKRSYMPTEEDEEQHEAKRRPPEHNLYLSHFESEEENPLPRANGEEDRKRIREPDWDASNLAGTKRRRKNTHIVNNEILSSLSSSIGLRQISLTPVVEKPKNTVSIGTQVSLIKDIPEKQQKEEAAQTVLVKPAKEVKEAATMPDPPQPMRSRSPVKEKVVTNMNGILKSALSKFNIQPKEDSKKSENVFDHENQNCIKIDSSKPDSVPSTPKSVDSETPKIPPILNERTSLSPKTSIGTQGSLSSASGGFQLPITSSPSFTFGVAPTPSVSTSEKTDPADKSGGKNQMLSVDSVKSNKLLDSPNKTEDKKMESPLFMFNSTSKEAANPGSLFKFGSSLQPTTTPAPTTSVTSSIQEPTTVVTTVASGLFNFSSNVSSTSGANSKALATPFTFGSSNSQTPSGSSILSTTKAEETSSVATPAVSFLPQSVAQFSHSPSTATTALAKITTTTTAAATPKHEPFKFESSSPFSFKDKTSNGVSDKPNEEKKDSGNTGIFSFGKVENKPDSEGDKSVAVATKPFQFGGSSGGFSFGHAPSTSKTEIISNPFTQKTTSSSLPLPSGDNSKPVFSFSGNSTKIENPFGNSGFSFNKPLTSATTSLDSKAVVSFTGVSSSSTTATSGSAATTISATSTAPTFPPSLFSSNTNNTSTTTSTATPIVSSTGSVPTAFTSGKPVFGDASKTFGISTTTTKASAATFGSTSSGFGSGSLFGTNSSTPLFSNSTATATTTTATATTSQKSNTTIFGSTIGNAGTNPPTAFPSTPAFGSALSGSNPPSFGASTSNNTTFGTTASNTNPSLFGGTVTGSTPAFGNATTTTGTTFDSTATPVPSFGSTASAGTSAPSFGSTAPTGANASAFGNSLGANTSAPAFGTSGTPVAGAPSFGIPSTTTAPIFGSSAGTTAPAFGSTGANTGQNTFGSSQTNVPSFGSTASTPAFGSTGTSNFGSTATPTPVFGGQSQVPTFGSQTTAFGSTPAFGQSSAPSNFGSQNTFGGQSATPGFGTTPAFGSSTNFNAVPTPTASAFGSSSSTFGSSTTFGGQGANKPFTFNAPASQPASSGSFNFTSAQQPQASGNLFQFGAASNAQPNQPFQFNATQPNTPVGGTGQQMFSIGSGSTAPRRMTARRKK